MRPEILILRSSHTVLMNMQRMRWDLEGLEFAQLLDGRMVCVQTKGRARRHTVIDGAG